ncbi:HNH endonuclease [Halopenitus malekzadehii]|uniref:HNH endonuclease n=1 Tax=Halopenitus malekzadehii TaxID=1267564 RepID=UPI00373FD97C
MGREPDVHHLKPVREFEDPQDTHTLSNAVTLCRLCHRLAEAGTIEITSPKQ